MVPLGVSYKYLSSFNVWFRGPGRGFGSAPLQKHKRWRQGTGRVIKQSNLDNGETEHRH